MAYHPACVCVCVCVCVQDEATFHLTDAGRSAVAELGSQLIRKSFLPLMTQHCFLSSSLPLSPPSPPPPLLPPSLSSSFPSSSPGSISWRDMWALVAQKGSAPLGEDVGKAVSAATWGSPVNLHVSLPASTQEGNLRNFGLNCGVISCPTQLSSVTGQRQRRMFGGAGSVLVTRDMAICATVPTLHHCTSTHHL